MIEAYRNTHGGSSPSPALVRQILLSTAQDLRYPSAEQGAGLVDARAAVHEAEIVDGGAGSPRAPGWAAQSEPAFLAAPGQLDLVSPSGKDSQGVVTVSNPTGAAERIGASVRSLAMPFADQAGQVTLDPDSDPTFVDDFGDPQSYGKVSFTVPPGVDVLGASQAHGGDGVPVGMTLFDPAGRLANYTQDAGPADYSHAEVSNPAPGKWTALFYTPQSYGLSGQVIYDFTFSRFASVASVSPQSLLLAPHGRGAFFVRLPGSSTPGDVDSDLVLDNGAGQKSVVPLVVRTLVPLSDGRGTFAGSVPGGDGFSGLASRDTFQFDVPFHTPAVGVDLNLANAPGTGLFGVLVAPDGETEAEGVSADDGSGN